MRAYQATGKVVYDCGHQRTAKPFRAQKLRLLCLVSLLAISPLLAEPGTPVSESSNRLAEQFTIVAENDYFAGKDSGYTSGSMLSYAQEQKEGSRQLAIGQVIMTAEDFGAKTAAPTDQPYAGLLYLAGSWTRKINQTASHSVGVLSGLVGPGAQAERTQQEIHKLTDYSMPQGWAHQLDDEPVLNVSYEYRHVLKPSWQGNDYWWDLTNYAGMHVGNLISALKGGGALRFGVNLPRTPVDPVYRGGICSIPQFSRTLSRHPALYFTLGAEAQYVNNYLLLEGNTWKESHGVELVHEQGVLFAGINLGANRLNVGFQMLWGSKQFETQRLKTAYGSCTLSYSF